MAGPNPGNPYPATLGAPGSCAVVAGNGCGWTVAVSDSWIQIQGSASGSGSGTVNFTLNGNTSIDSRTGTIAIQGRGASCQIRQNGILGATAESRSVMTSELLVKDGNGQVVLDGTEVFYQGEGPFQVPIAGSARRRAVATLVSGAGSPGLWRFHITGLEPGSVAVIAGQVASIDAESVVFRLTGRPGERMVFSFGAVTK
jgi:hypothetical protein